PIAVGDHTVGEDDDDNPGQHADDARNGGVKQVVQRALVGVRVGAAQRVETVGALGTDCGPHQGPTKQESYQQNGQEEPAGQDKWPNDADKQDPEVELKQYTKEGNRDDGD